MKSNKGPMNILYFVSYNNGKKSWEHPLNRSKLILGSSAQCDIVISSEHISSYHAYINLITPDHGFITDLGSKNGITINGEKIENGEFFSGDRITFADQEVYIEERVESSVGKERPPFTDLEETIRPLVLKEDLIKTPELPPIENYELIDGEYCDIKFSENHSYSPEKIIFGLEDMDYEQFIDFEKESPKQEKILKKSTGHVLEITKYSGEHIIDINYLPLGKKDILLSGTSKKNHILFEALEEKESFPLIKFKQKSPYFFNLKGFNTHHVSNLKIQLKDEFKFEKLELGEQVFYQKETLSLKIEIVKRPKGMVLFPFFGRDRQFQKETLKIVSSIMGIMLLLLLVPLKVPEPPKERKVAIIYKTIKAPKIQKKSAEEISKNDLNPGINNKMPPTKEIKKPKVVKTREKKNKISKVKPKPISKPVAKKIVKKSKPVKLKIKKSLLSFFKSETKTNVVRRKQKRSPSSISAKNNSPTQKMVNLKNTASSSMNSLVKEMKGQVEFSYGPKGMSNRKGANTLYTSYKTVILGAIDPELLRKILREYLPQFRHCYQKELRRSEGAEGVLDLNFNINKNGKAFRVAIKSKKSQFSRNGVNCMAGVLRIINFPKPKGGGTVSVRQPLNFFSEKTHI